MKSVDIKTKNGICDATLFAPEIDGSFSAVLLLMDAFGPRPYLFEMADTISSHGYIVLVPNLFYMQKRAPIVDLKFPLKTEDLPAARNMFMPLLQNFDVQATLEGLGECLSFLSTQKNFNGKIGLTGYCMGGSFAIRAAAQFPERINATASFHAGRLASEAPDSPHLLLNKINGPLYVAHADNDPSMPMDQITIFNEAFLKAGVKGKAELYDGAMHGFTMRDLPPYNEAALNRHWEHLLKLLSDM